MKKHITPVVMAMIKKGDKFLLTKRVEKVDDPEGVQMEFHELWQIPGGGLQFGESVENGVRREIREELNVEIKNIRLLSNIFHRIYNDQWHGIFLTYVAELDSPESQIKLNQEANEWQWFTLDEIKKLNKFPHIDEIAELAL